MKQYVALLLSLVLGFTGISNGGFQTNYQSDSLNEQALDEFILGQMEKQNLPGVAVAITQGEDTVYLKAFGEASRDVPLETNTPMYIGSISKSFTALAIMQLAEKDDLDIDAPVIDYLPWFSLADQQAAQTITIRNLLNHTSGLSDFGYMPDLDPETSIQNGVRSMINAKLTAPIGTTFQYFNSNYAILGAVVEEASGRTYEEYVQENIFEPLQMNDSFAGESSARSAGLTDGYGSFFSFSLPRRQEFKQYDLPAGYLSISVEDLSKYLRAQINDGEFQNVSILSKDGITAMHTPNEEINSSYGMGWFQYEKNGYQVIEHGGTNENYHSAAYLLPELDMTISILVNKNGLLNSLWGNPQLNDGVFAIVTGNTAPSGGLSMRLLGLLLLAGFIINMVFNVQALFKMKTWYEKFKLQKGFSRMWDVCSHFVITAALLILLPLGVEAYLQKGFSWKESLYQAPDLMLWFGLGILFDMLQGVWKIVILLRKKNTEPAK